MKSSKLPEAERVARRKRIMEKRLETRLLHAARIKQYGNYRVYKQYLGTVFKHPSLKEQRS